jgi:hypothetical protein
MLKTFLPSIASSLFLLTSSVAANDGTHTLPVQYVTDVPLFYHLATNIFPNERIVQLEDESRWKVAESDMRDLVFSWREGDFMVVTRNRQWFTDYTYCLTNQANRTSVRANLISGPLHSSPYTHHITGMDQNTPSKKVFYLDGLTSWSISSDDFRIADDWQINDTIIILSNDSWFTSYDVVLLCVETNTSAKARRM